MLSGKNKIVVISILDNVLGVGFSLKHNEQVHLCPFCHHHKQKLQVNLDTQKWHCWVCNAKGKRIKSLLSRLNTDLSDIERIKAIYGDDDTDVSTNDTEVKLYLPKEFKQLYFKPKSINPIYNQAISYLKGRKISMSDIVKYNIGYCENGLYGGRIIIPSYDENGELNYFIARSFYEGTASYKNPTVSRNVIVFENQIVWSEKELTIVEGVFDSFSVKRNVIPLLGKFLLPKLKDKILSEGIKCVNLCLDPDALDATIKIAEFLMRNNISVKIINPLPYKDIGDMKFEDAIPLIKDTNLIDFSKLMIMKIGTI